MPLRLLRVVLSRSLRGLVGGIVAYVMVLSVAGTNAVLSPEYTHTRVHVRQTVAGSFPSGTRGGTTALKLKDPRTASVQPSRDLDRIASVARFEQALAR